MHTRVLLKGFLSAHQIATKKLGWQCVTLHVFLHERLVDQREKAKHVKAGRDLRPNHESGLTMLQPASSQRRFVIHE